jgi:N-acetylneuraminic acid mutarotase
MWQSANGSVAYGMKASAINNKHRKRMAISGKAKMKWRKPAKRKAINNGENRKWRNNENQWRKYERK